MNQTIKIWDGGRRLSIGLGPAPRAPHWDGPRGSALRPLGLPFGPDVPLRPEIDILVDGHAYPGPDGRSGTVRVRAGSIDRRVKVWGPRVSQEGPQGVTFSSLQAFESVPLSRKLAYGGRSGELVYPRNSIGVGYVVRGVDPLGVSLPQLEEEGDELTPARFVASHEAWWEQPLPALFEPLMPVEFPRFAMLGLPRWCPLPSAARAREVASGDVTAEALADAPALSPLGLQEAPRRSRLAELRPGLELVVEGCRRDGKPAVFRAPREPNVVVEVEGKPVDFALRPQLVRLVPETGEVFVRYGADVALPRAFVPGLHKRIPIVVRIEGEAFPFPAPEPVLARVRRALAEPTPPRTPEEPR